MGSLLHWEGSPQSVVYGRSLHHEIEDVGEPPAQVGIGSGEDPVGKHALGRARLLVTTQHGNHHQHTVEVEAGTQDGSTQIVVGLGERDERYQLAVVVVDQAALRIAQHQAGQFLVALAVKLAQLLPYLGELTSVVGIHIVERLGHGLVHLIAHGTLGWEVVVEEAGRESVLEVGDEGVHPRFFCEEQDEHDDLHAGELFIIDPIDGTMNFVHGFHHSCLSVAYVRGGELCAAAIYNPYVDEMFTAIRGEGAFLNGRPIRVGGEALRDSIVCFGTAPYDLDLADEGFALARLAFDASLDLRREGAAALDLCSVAAGRAGLYFEMRVSLWDYAAGLLIVQEAGGACARLDGRPLGLEPARDSIAAGAPGALAEFLALVRNGRT